MKIFLILLSVAVAISCWKITLNSNQNKTKNCYDVYRARNGCLQYDNAALERIRYQKQLNKKEKQYGK